ncbi:VanW family protein [Actinomadura luteofluorescens]|uniref:VanW family protein n=1 Tax=Actinomadura luteofluorescens TaxID=46163 RepID=UPI0030D40731
MGRIGPGRRREGRGRRERLRRGVRRWWPVAAGTAASAGLLLGVYLEGPRLSGVSAALSVPYRDGPGRGGPGELPPERLMSTFTTRFAPGEPRVHNIELAARTLDGRVVEPGATFSFNDAVGPRTRDRGYVPAPAIMGSRLADDVGGGICQVSTTLYNAVFLAGLDIRKARAHTLWMPEYPEGREAAVFYPQLDFTWRNDTGEPVRIQVAYSAESVTVNLWGRRRYEVRSRTSERYGFRSFESEAGRVGECIPMTGREGFEVDVWRTLLADGREVRHERFHTEYRPQPEVECL